MISSSERRCTINDTAELSAVIEDGEFPEDLNWDAEYAVLADPEGGDHPVPESLWIDALIYEGPGISDMLINADTYHARVGPFDSLLGFRFEFSLDERGRIVASGVCHPTTESMKGDYYPDFSSEADARRVLVMFKSQRSEKLVSAFIRTGME